MAEHFTRFTANILSKNMARTARSQLDGRHLLFGVIGQKLIKDDHLGQVMNLNT